MLEAPLDPAHSEDILLRLNERHQSEQIGPAHEIVVLRQLSVYDLYQEHHGQAVFLIERRNQTPNPLKRSEVEDLPPNAQKSVLILVLQGIQASHIEKVELALQQGLVDESPAQAQVDALL